MNPRAASASALTGSSAATNSASSGASSGSLASAIFSSAMWKPGSVIGQAYRVPAQSRVGA
jgi:hypothetical protein